MADLVEVDAFSVTLRRKPSDIPILSGVTFAIAKDEVVGLVGESGSGKSTMARSVVRLLPEGAVTEGRLQFGGKSIPDLSADELRELRGRRIQMIFQDPRAHVNPIRKIGDFATEALRTNDGLGKDEAEARLSELLEQVGIKDPARRFRQYPQELSGGLLQRVTIAAALATNPELLIADEPTTALDVTTQADVVSLLRRLQQERAFAILFISHDLELAASLCTRMIVMYAGTVVESQAADDMEARPLHPYTAGLFASRPDISKKTPRLHSIPGRPLAASEAPKGCPFMPRCQFADARCGDRPELRAVGSGLVACHRSEEIEQELIEIVNSR